VDADRKELNMGYHFDGVSLGYVRAFQKIQIGVWSNLKNLFWLGCGKKRDGERFIWAIRKMVSRWGNDSAEFREYSSKMLTTFAFDERYTLLLLRGWNRYDAKFDNVEDYRDIETLAEYERLQNTGGDLIHRRPENGWRER
jgi:oligo-1,6-glucosidase